MNKEKIKFDHFKDVEELIKHLEMWYAEDDYDAYDRFFGLRDARIMGMIIYELNNDIKTLLKENEAKEKVIKKQDYVINELEKWLIEYRTFIDIPDYYEEGIIDCLDEVLDKLKELREEK